MEAEKEEKSKMISVASSTANTAAAAAAATTVGGLLHVLYDAESSGEQAADEEPEKVEDVFQCVVV